MNQYLCSVLVLSSNLWSGCAIVSLIILPLKGIWEFPVFSYHTHSCCGTFVSTVLHENMFSFLRDTCPRLQLLGHMVSPSSVFKGTAKLLSQVASRTILHTNQRCQGDLASPHDRQFAVVTIFYFGHSDRCRVRSPCGFNLHCLICISKRC